PPQAPQLRKLLPVPHLLSWPSTPKVPAAIVKLFDPAVKLDPWSGFESTETFGILPYAKTPPVLFLHSPPVSSRSRIAPAARRRRVPSRGLQLQRDRRYF